MLQNAAPSMSNGILFLITTCGIGKISFPSPYCRGTFNAELIPKATTPVTLFYSQGILQPQYSASCGTIPSRPTWVSHSHPELDMGVLLGDAHGNPPFHSAGEG